MKRREIAVLGGAAAWPLAARAQQAGKPYRIGVLSPAERTTIRVFDGLRQGLRELGYIDGRNIIIEYRLAAGDFSRLPAMAAELAQLPVDIVVPDGGDKITQIALNATRTIPIVAPTSFDPVAAGLAASLAHPGGNVTGLTMFAEELSGKRVQLLKEAFPAIRRVAVFWNPAAAPFSQVCGTEGAARKLGVRLQPIEITTAEQIGSGFDTALTGEAEGLIVISMFWNERAQIVALAARSRLPAIYPEREYADDGGVLAYGLNVPDNFRRAGAYIDKILKGAKPGDLPIEQPAKFEFIINRKAGSALGWAVPPTLLVRADEVIE
jgi:putative tryptophan/tyrosine transport system substrate-binding protein